MERTFVMVKPDGVKRGLIGEVIKRIEQKGLKIVAMKMMEVSKELAEKHYAEHKEKPFFQSLISYITSGPVVAMVVEGKEAVKVMRNLVGKTNPIEASPGTIRGDFAMDIGRNIVHASDSLESAEREISLFFNEEEILSYERADEKWIYEEA
ncbi:Nucleoside-diphosphate kinase [Ferroglobus placidus DSM 10642]|uniref:Nucleoside diphosphate kinase n=1 Tax=Ferroglobus placidus (strain DSM 10642 / AEDII12DO) TaxID=589924 RepID=D3S3F6_FERPA|nr:nucleoside-diphosphate kinase [Ferroglobus placidus]ADC64789.1 Nucleoside-diphosphate kinase [Ferroglobus placidus DSM 10642]